MDNGSGPNQITDYMLTMSEGFGGSGSGKEICLAGRHELERYLSHILFMALTNLHKIFYLTKGIITFKYRTDLSNPAIDTWKGTGSFNH